MPILDRIKTAWNAFVINENSWGGIDYSTGPPVFASSPPQRTFRSFSNERTIITSIYARMAIDVAGVPLRHAQLDEQKRYIEDVDSRLNDCLNFEANIDQAPRQFRMDIVLSMFDKGVAAIVPVDTTLDPNSNDVIDIYTLRVGEVTAWYPRHVRVNLYNEAKGIREEVTLEKKFVAIVENPLYTVMNSPNSTLQRLIKKLNLLDVVDEQSSSGKLDLIIQLPYVIKSEARRQQAETRRKDIENQLEGSRYGIAYTDGTEKITQLNRPVENNLLDQVKFLTEMLYSQLGLTADVMNGTADEKAMLNYWDRTIEPILDAIAEAMQRTFLGPIRTKRREKILYFRNLFKLAPLSVIAEISDKFTRNEIMSSNELRGFLGLPPSTDPKADELRNSNMPRSDTDLPAQPVSEADLVDTNSGV